MQKALGAIQYLSSIEIPGQQSGAQEDGGRDETQTSGTGNSVQGTTKNKLRQKMQSEKIGGSRGR